MMIIGLWRETQFRSLVRDVRYRSKCELELPRQRNEQVKLNEGRIVQLGGKAGW
jgi:hypothetical protein